MRDEPIFSLPKDLQDKKAKLIKQKSLIDYQIKSLLLEIVARRKNCKHVPIAGTEGNCATYCMFCGEMIDSWL